MSYLYPVMWISLLYKFANYRVLIILTIVSEILNPFKYVITIYILKVCIDIPKEMIKIIVINDTYINKQ